MTSILKVDQLQDSGGNAIITSDGSGNLTAGTIPAKTIGTGAVLQTKYYQTGASLTATNTSWADLGSFSVTITPISTSSIILLSANFGAALGSSGNNTTLFRFTRNGTAVAIGDQEGSNRPRASFRTSSVVKLINGDTNHTLGLTFSAIDAPSSTAALTYKIQNWNEGATFYLNRNDAYADNAANYSAVTFSSFIVQEIAG